MCPISSSAGGVEVERPSFCVGLRRSDVAGAGARHGMHPFFCGPWSGPRVSELEVGGPSRGLPSWLFAGRGVIVVVDGGSAAGYPGNRGVRCYEMACIV